MRTTLPRPRPRRSDAGYSLIELLISMGMFTAIMGLTMAGLSNATRANQVVLGMASMNAGMRAGMDLIVRDMLQAGSGLPPNHVIEIPSGVGAQRVRLPGPPGTPTFELPLRPDIPAVYPMPGSGPIVNDADSNTDVLIVLMADNAFVNLSLTAVTPTSVTVAPGPVLDAGPDRVMPGQLMMVTKSSTSTLVQVTAVDYASRVLTFAAGDSLRLNQPGAQSGTLAAVNATDPANRPELMQISRIRMIAYYLDATTDPDRPRLVRRVNAGHPTTFSNDLGTAVAMDVENLRFTFDIVNGADNPANVRMTDADRAGTGRCMPVACDEVQIHKVNILLNGRTQRQELGAMRNTLTTQVSFRGMAFVNEYQTP